MESSIEQSCEGTKVRVNSCYCHSEGGTTEESHLFKGIQKRFFRPYNRDVRMTKRGKRKYRIMSWECPYWNHNICDLNGIECKPGKGHCVLRNRFEIASSKSTKINSRTESIHKTQNHKGKTKGNTEND